jgi:hypothetical protein
MGVERYRHVIPLERGWRLLDPESWKRRLDFELQSVPAGL